MSGRIFFSTLINMDEAYKFFKMVGLLPPTSAGKQQDGAHTCHDAASELNKTISGRHDFFHHEN